ncbi:MAG: hypothetical protein B7Z66_05725 [Chromatiales bacterium 21-64-14]|nr:MAG: hypothetical protein B7Z66_05725 [Chromatiales bacterium 21-64-14]HQU15199.1 hypothetical protein [Gammaproteobacteria bacterium]
MKQSLLFALTLTALSTGVALAASDHSGLKALSHQQFQQLDANHDGYIDQSEAKHLKSLDQDFAKVSKDGKMDEADFAAWEARKPEDGVKPASSTYSHPAE